MDKQGSNNMPKVRYGSLRQIYHGVVTQMDYWIGITIQEEGNLDNYLFCMHGYYSPEHSIHPSKNYIQKYIRIYSYIKKCIEEDKLINADKIRDTFSPFESTFRGPSAATCPFSQ